MNAIRKHWRGPALLLAVAAMVTAVAAAAAPRDERDPGRADGQKVQAPTTYRVSTINGMEVRNHSGESLGKIDDLVIDLDAGCVQYAALSVGGFLGFGDRLFAIPWNQFTLQRDQDATYFVLDVDKQRLEKAPGFDKNNWPDMASADWKKQIDAFYAPGNSHEGRFEGIAGTTFFMTGGPNQTRHSHTLAGDVEVVVEGRPAGLDALKPGDPIRVTVGESDGTAVVTRIEVLKRR